MKEFKPTNHELGYRSPRPLSKAMLKYLSKHDRHAYRRGFRRPASVPETPPRIGVPLGTRVVFRRDEGEQAEPAEATELSEQRPERLDRSPPPQNKTKKKSKRPAEVIVETVAENVTEAVNETPPPEEPKKKRKKSKKKTVEVTEAADVDVTEAADVTPPPEEPKRKKRRLRKAILTKESSEPPVTEAHHIEQPLPPVLETIPEEQHEPLTTYTSVEWDIPQLNLPENLDLGTEVVLDDEEEDDEPNFNAPPLVTAVDVTGITKSAEERIILGENERELKSMEEVSFNRAERAFPTIGLVEGREGEKDAIGTPPSPPPSASHTSRGPVLEGTPIETSTHTLNQTQTNLTEDDSWSSVELVTREPSLTPSSSQ